MSLLEVSVLDIDTALFSGSQLLVCMEFHLDASLQALNISSFLVGHFKWRLCTSSMLKAKERCELDATTVGLIHTFLRIFGILFPDRLILELPRSIMTSKLPMFWPSALQRVFEGYPLLFISLHLLLVNSWVLLQT
eukprot:jgi/Galph1/2147/GphlegSOOS_G824.1